ncbi:MAG: archaeosortase/exosortase family protein [Thermoplasmatota archaeon]
MGLAVLGDGVAILVGAVPHEDRLDGGALAAFGLALLATAPRFPRIERLSKTLVGGIGAALALGVIAYDAFFGAALDGPKLALIFLGAALVAVAPFLSHSLHIPGRRARVMPVASIVAAALPVLGAPLGVWAMQAGFKSLVGGTPIELFVRFGLLAPVSVALTALGWVPSVTGQALTYATPAGPLTVEVGAACSGVQAMALFAGVLALFVFAERPPPRELAWWCFVGLAGVYVVNLLRLGLLAAVGYRWGGDALMRVHAEAGWVLFVAWAIAFAWLARNRSPTTGASVVPE